LRFSEKVAVRFSHEVIADNQAIADYVKEAYGVDAHVIAYGGDHAVAVDAAPVDELGLPERYAFSVCRIEPENNVHLILEAFAGLSEWSLVMVGNWNSSDYGRKLIRQYSSNHSLMLFDPIYDLGKLKTLREEMACYVHGHSAGGTNPSLVEAMHFGKPILAFDCDFNRCTTEDQALYFQKPEQLIDKLALASDYETWGKIGEDMREIARHRYSWNIVGEAYYSLMK
jgi:glycosyltransferase involved in cell wall biosynthesis